VSKAEVLTVTINKHCFAFLFIIHTSILVLFPDLLYHDKSLGSSAQTIRPGWVGPVSILLGDEGLTGCFF